MNRTDRNEADPYLERVETAIRDGVKESVPMAMAKNLLEMLTPFLKESVGENNLSDRALTIEKTENEGAENTLDWEQEADMDTAHLRCHSGRRKADVHWTSCALHLPKGHLSPLRFGRC